MEPQRSQFQPTNNEANGVPRASSVEPEGLNPKKARNQMANEPPIDSLVEDEDPMDLDEGDFAGNEAKFQKEIELLEAKKIDLSSRRLRGSTPIERLDLLESLFYLDIDFTTPKHVELEKLLTPKIEEEDPAQIISIPPATTPELAALPYLIREPLTPLSESEALKECIARNERSKEAVGQILRHTFLVKQTHMDALRDEYRSLYKPWKRHCEELDREYQDQDDGERIQTSAEPDVNPTVETNVVNPALGPAESRRGRALASEYDIQRAMQESLLSELEAQARRDRESLRVKPDLHREAELPDILPEGEARQQALVDHTCLRDPQNALSFYEFFPPQDNFTEEEHNVVVNGFRDYPKKFGKLAESLPGRNYKDVINHYYATKWAKEFKPPKDRRRKGNRKPRGANGPTSRKSNALISNLGNGTQPEVYDGGEFGTPIVSITETGRPRRAAAPTFGEKDSDEASKDATPARKGKSDAAGETSNEKPARRPKGVGRDKSQKRIKASVSVQQTASPEKMDRATARPTTELRETNDMMSKELEVAQGLANMQSQLQSSQPQLIMERVELQPTYPAETYPPQAVLLAAEMENRDMMPGQQAKGTTTSYWSVQEVTIFPQLLAHFGTDWQSIATHMGSKTQTMVSL